MIDPTKVLRSALMDSLDSSFMSSCTLDSSFIVRAYGWPVGAITVKLLWDKGGETNEDS